MLAEIQKNAIRRQIYAWLHDVLTYIIFLGLCIYYWPHLYFFALRRLSTCTRTNCWETPAEGSNWTAHEWMQEREIMRSLIGANSRLLINVRDRQSIKTISYATEHFILFTIPISVLQRPFFIVSPVGEWIHVPAQPHIFPIPSCAPTHGEHFQIKSSFQPFHVVSQLSALIMLFLSLPRA